MLWFPDGLRSGHLFNALLVSAHTANSNSPYLFLRLFLTRLPSKAHLLTSGKAEALPPTSTFYWVKIPTAKQWKYSTESQLFNKVYFRAKST